MTNTAESPSLGQQLKHARESLNLSIEEVAKKTNLKKNHLESLENDIFVLKNVPPAFVRGYVGNYLRFLRLPETLVSSVNYGEVTIPKNIKKINPSAPIKVSNSKSQARWVKGFTWIVLLAAVGMTLTWWWQEHKKDQENLNNLVTAVASAPAASAESTSQPISVAEPQSVVVAPANTGSPTTEAAPAQPAQNEVAPAPVAAGNTVVATEPAQAAPTVATNTPAVVTEVQPPQTEVVNILQQPEATAAAAATTEEPATAQPAAADNSELRIEVTGAESWITVRDAKNKRLAEKLYSNGEVLSFNDNEQYRLTIGAPANVKIYYKGQEVPLKVDGRVARFKLPLAN